MIYILYLLGVFLPAFTLVGVVLAYINRADAPDWLYSHYRFQIRTFWLSILLFFIGSILLIIVIGQLVLLFWFVWAMVRIIKGLTLLSRDEAHPNPDTYLFT
ncbi:MAG: hypothetical protein CMF31_02300 [Kordiimonas sp.]|nr:hypothetical protein [Kordiimonas sp.]